MTGPVNHTPSVGQYFRHYKRNTLYMVVAVSRAEWEPENLLVTYKEEKIPSYVCWTRPLEDFCGWVEDKKCWRFEPVKE